MAKQKETPSEGAALSKKHGRTREKDIKTNAMRILEQKKIPYTVHTYDCEEFMDGVTMADALGQPHELVYKTLVTVAKSKEHYADRSDRLRAGRLYLHRHEEAVPGGDG